MTIVTMIRTVPLVLEHAADALPRDAERGDPCAQSSGGGWRRQKPVTSSPRMPGTIPGES